jgi:succinate-acetate transporter protein
MQHCDKRHHRQSSASGLLGFGMTTVLLNIHNAGFYPLDSMILGMGLFLWRIGPGNCRYMEWKKNNTFGTTAFTSYGLFWWSLAAILILPKANLGAIPVPAAMATYLFMWGYITLAMFFGTLKLNRALQLVFAH